MLRRPFSALSTRSCWRTRLGSSARRVSNGVTSPAPKNQYRDVLQTLLSINKDRKVKFGVENTQDLLRVLPKTYDPQNFPTLHVTGTNGKGSVCVKLVKLLQESGLKVGLFTSPHISSFRERMLVNNELIPEEEVVRLAPPLFEACAKHNIPATFFELSTLLGFGHFARSKVDVAVIEVGLGGRLDSTNVIDPVLSVITSIALEHTQYLGNTIELITKEKAGIIKPGRPVVVGNHVPRHIVEQEAESKGSRVIYVPIKQHKDFDEENQLIARTAFNEVKTLLPLKRQLSEQQVNEFLLAKPPCRTQEIFVPNPRAGKDKIRVILDVAHNPQGFDRLFTVLRHRFPHNSIRAVVGFSKEKDATGCLEVLLKHANYAHFVKADSHRAADVNEVLATLKSNPELAKQQGVVSIVHNAQVIPTVQHAVEQAASHNNAHPNSPPEIVVICGTFFIMRDVRTALGLDHLYPRDPVDLNETFAPASTPLNPPTSSSTVVNPRIIATNAHAAAAGR